MALVWDFKDSNEVLDYYVDWASRMTENDEIASSDWEFAEDPDEALDIDSNSFNVSTHKTLVWLSGGTAGQSYELTNRITTTDGRTMDQTVKLKIKEK